MQSYFSTTLSSSIVAGDTVIPLNAVPTGTEGFLVIDQNNASVEVIYYNSKGASSVTCPSAASGRGQGGTTAGSHSSGATVKMNFVDQYWSELQNGNAISKVPMGVAYNPYKFSVYRSAAWNTGTGGQSNLVQFDTKTFDTGTNVDVVTNKGRFTAPVAGFYQFEAGVKTSTTNMYLLASLFKNGVSAKVGQGVFNAAGAVGTSNTVAGLLSLAANDYVEVYLFATTSTQGGATGADATYFDGFLVSKT